MYKYCSTAQTRLDLGKGRTKTIDDDKFHNTDAYMNTEMIFSGKAGKVLKGGFTKGTRAKEKDIFDTSFSKKDPNDKETDQKEDNPKDDNPKKYTKKKSKNNSKKKTKKKSKKPVKKNKKRR